MKKLLVVLLLFVSQVGFCQEYPWKCNPETILKLATTLNYKLDGQDTNKYNQVFLNYNAKKGIMIVYVFTDRKLTMVRKYYDTEIVTPSKPSGKEETIDGNGYWGDKQKHILTVREYKERFIIDKIMPWTNK